MTALTNKITLKVILSYFALTLLVVVVGYIVYGEFTNFVEIQQKDTQEKNHVLRFGKLLTYMYESEGLARTAQQSDNPGVISLYEAKKDSITKEIELLKQIIQDSAQRQRLDSIAILIDQKAENITALQRIRNDKGSEVTLQRAINQLSSIESTLGRLTLEDYTKDPEKLSPRIRDLLEERIAIYNKYIPRDSTNSVDQSTLDSIVTVSRNVLQSIQQEVAQERQELIFEERKLQQKDVIISEQLREIIADFEQEFLQTARTVGLEQKSIQRKSVDTIIYAAILAAILVIIFSVLIVNDFWNTQRYRVKAEKTSEYNQKLLKNREQLISMVSHDLKTPLGTISGYSELLNESALAIKDHYYVDRIKKASHYVNQLVDDLMDYSKLEAHKITIEKVPFHLGDLIKDVIDQYSDIHPERSVEIILHIDDVSGQRLVGDPFRIRQILSNLIGNAVKFTSEGSIWVSAKLNKNKDLVTIEIKDTGIGIQSEKQTLIFEEFTQAEESIEKQYGGSGLGLTISKKLVTLLNGTLSLTSKVGVGSTFTVILPAQLEEPHLSKDQPDSAPDSATISAVLIDDDEALLELITILMNRENIKVHPFNSGAKAVQHIKDLNYNLILTDIQLPDFNGFHIAEQLKNSPDFNYIGQPIIAMTGRQNIDESSYLDAGFSAVLKKPFSAIHLQQVVKRALYPGTNTPHAYSNGNISMDTAITDFIHDPEDEKYVRSLFKTSSTKDLKELHSAVINDDQKTVSAKLHKMRTMYLQVNATDLVDLLDRLDQTTNVKKQLTLTKKMIKKNTVLFKTSLKS
ncbi:ATP-binding protein [Gangjinia marincola]|uniref:histidine kinase n=1 Tax=Gangjinia marincola TaxID=578463 RepID=A0ABP3XUR5_9FLAO